MWYIVYKISDVSEMMHMKEKIMSKIDFKSQLVRTVAAGFVLFLCAFAFSPEARIVRTIPLFLVGGARSFVLVSSVKLVLSFSFVMTLCAYLALSGNVGKALFFAVVSCLLSSAGIYVFRFLKAAKKTQKSIVRKKCIFSAAFCCAVAVVLSFVLCGDAVSFVIHDAENTQYIKENYPTDVVKSYTAYDFSKGEYLTFVSFRDGDDVYGNADECYINADVKHFNDGVRNHYEETMLVSAKASLAYVISGATWGYNITASDIAFEKGEILTSDSDINDYLDRINYVVSFQTLFGKNDKEKFVIVCEDTVAVLKANGFEFERIVLCGGDAENVLFCAEITMETGKDDVSVLVRDFDEKIVESIGVTEMTILDYWKNK